MPGRTYTFQAKVWLYSGDKAAWHFLTLPTDIAADIDYFFGHLKNGWGSHKVLVTIGNSTWKTSIFPDKKSQSYLLPLKAAVRKHEHCTVGDTVQVQMEVI